MLLVCELFYWDRFVYIPIFDNLFAAMIKIIVSSIALLLICHFVFSKPSSKIKVEQDVVIVALTGLSQSTTVSNHQLTMSNYHSQRLFSKTIVFIVFIGFILLYYSLKDNAVNIQIILHYLACITLTSILFFACNKEFIGGTLENLH